jgi:hypothetical protein
MKMCEYANNLIDMILLVYVTERNKEIVYERDRDYEPSMLFVYMPYGSFHMVLPIIMYSELDYIEIYGEEDFYAIMFEEASDIDLDYRIFFGD